VFFFFFQAEDGIRDLIVTGVQTCALPILTSRGQAFLPLGPPCAPAERVASLRPWCRRCTYSGFHARQPDGAADATRSGTGAPDRSEERRVGKECRCRWARDE